MAPALPCPRSPRPPSPCGGGDGGGGDVGAVPGWSLAVQRANTGAADRAQVRPYDKLVDRRGGLVGANLGPVCGASVRPLLFQIPCIHAEKTLYCPYARWLLWTDRDRP